MVFEQAGYLFAGRKSAVHDFDRGPVTPKLASYRAVSEVGEGVNGRGTTLIPCGTSLATLADVINDHDLIRCVIVLTQAVSSSMYSW